MRLTHFFEPAYNTKGPLGYLSMASILLMPIEQIVQEYLEKQSMRCTPDLQKEEPSISSPPIDLIASALADFRG